MKFFRNKLKSNFNFNFSFKNKSVQSNMKKLLGLTFAGILVSQINEYKNINLDLIINDRFYSLEPSVLECYKVENKEIKKVKDRINKAIDELEFKYQGNMIRQPIDFGIRNGKYYIEFVINKANVNPDSIINTILKFEKRKNQKDLGKIDKGNKNEIIIKDQQSLKEDDLYSVRIDYECNSDSVAMAKNNGSIYLVGTFGKVYDSFTFKLEKTNDFTECDINMILSSYEEAFKPVNVNVNNNSSNTFFDKLKNVKFINGSNNNEVVKNGEDPLSILNKNGVTVFQPSQDKIHDFSYLAGYENQKRMIEDNIMLGLIHRDIFDQITHSTRVKFESNKPRAILFEGPPGCGKTTSAKIIANQVKIPLVYVPLESIMSKWYGESETKFNTIFEATKALGKSIIFIDEIDSLATSRDDGIHEATRRILSTLLRKLDGFDTDGDVLFICATNRRKDLDPALLSRLDVTITFDLPDKRMRALIFQKYAKQLSNTELEKLSELSEHFSGRDISDLCKDAERKWASMYLRKEKKNIIPEFDVYLASLEQRKAYKI